MRGLEALKGAHLCAIAFSILAACGDQLPTAYLVYARDAQSGEYRFIQSSIETLTRPHVGAGELMTLRGGGELVVSLSAEQTKEGLLDALKIRGDSEPDIRFDIDEDGVAVPWDFDSAMLLTSYHHLERAVTFFESVGINRERVGKTEVYYFSELRVPFIPFNLLTDNAAYVVTLDAFWIPPRLVLEDVPLCANQGVLTHEYSHALFNRLVWADQRVTPVMLPSFPRAPGNTLRSLDEGVADVLAAIATGDPNFITASISTELFDIDRDLRQERHYNDELRSQVLDEAPEEYNPYLLGSVIASATWALREGVEDEVLARAVLTALESIAVPNESFRLATFFDALVLELPEDEQGDACAHLYNRLDAIRTDLRCTPR